ncbi:pro-FMRFamide-related neuropeptide VF [Stigmatopora nigra]
MLIKILLSLLLMMGGPVGVFAVSDPMVTGKLFHFGKDEQILDGGWNARRMETQQTKSKIQRSMDPNNMQIDVVPSRSKTRFPSMVKLRPPASVSSTKWQNMPLRFGRDSDNEATPNKPQRFGRAREIPWFPDLEASQKQRPNILSRMFLRRLTRAKLWKWRIHG